jgi:hypothetical protein
MTSQQNTVYLNAFKCLVHQAAPPVAPEVCSDPEVIPTPSEWATTALAFTPDPKQTAILDHHAHRLILCCSRQWGKTTIIAIKALHTAIYRPKSEILVLSRSQKQAGLLVAKVCLFAAVLGFPKKRVLGEAFSVELPNGSKIYAVAHSEKTGRGYTADIVIVDEAALVADDVIGSITPTLTRTEGKLWFLSTPNGESGLFYNVWHDQELTNWYRVKATIEDSSYATPEFIAEQTKLFPHNVRQDFYCEFMPATGRAFTRERVDAMVDHSIVPVHFNRLGDNLP